ncbi:hypothetical protein TI10_18265 [Photorhabdus luminescens subsp. luminescens]|nr:hypothetical protein TI10_18265 [Photorhabdus luminescens subsp. luminescens]
MNNIKLYPNLHHVLVNIAGRQKNNITKRSNWNTSRYNQYFIALTIIHVTLLYYCEIIFGDISCNL